MKSEEFENNVPDNESESFAMENANDSTVNTVSKNTTFVRTLVKRFQIKLICLQQKKPYQQEWISNEQTSSQQNVSPSTTKNTKSTILVVRICSYYQLICCVQLMNKFLTIQEQNNCTSDKNKLIPRLSDCKSKAISIRPDTWDVEDVAEFLKINDCATYCDAFIKKVIFNT